MFTDSKSTVNVISLLDSGRMVGFPATSCSTMIIIYQAESKSPEISNPVEEGIAWRKFLVALIKTGIKALDHSKVTGAIIHIFPNETHGLQLPMGVSSHHGECIQIGAIGYEGKSRQLLSPSDTQAASTKKRGMYGKMMEKLQVASKHHIPKLPINNFAVDGEIKSSMYNIPNIPDVNPTIGSLYPQRKEMYQITSDDSYVIKRDHLQSRVKEHFKLLSGEKLILWSLPIGLESLRSKKSSTRKTRK